jgi:hypothetical protein
LVVRINWVQSCKEFIYWSSQFNCWRHLVWILDVNSYCEGTSLSTSLNIFSRNKNIAPKKWCWQQSVQQNLVLVCRTTMIWVYSWHIYMMHLNVHTTTMHNACIVSCKLVCSLYRSYTTKMVQNLCKRDCLECRGIVM